MRNAFYLLLLFLCSHVVAQHRITGYLGIEQGLSNNSVTCIHRDHKGFMWFGTYDGLNRYDGYAIRSFRNRLHDSTSLAYNRITAILEDPLGNIWVGTKHGLCTYNDSSGLFSQVQYQPCNSNAKQQVVSEIYSIAADKSGNILAGTADKGLLAGKRGKKELYQVPLPSATGPVAYAVAGIVTDEKNNSWLFINGRGLFRYDADNQKIVQVNNQLLAANCLLAAGQGRILAGTDDGLHRYDISTGQWESLSQAAGCSGSKIINLVKDHEGQLWISTDGDGIFIFSEKAGKATVMKAGNDREGLTSNAVYAVYEDKDQRKWIGTLRGGINIIDRQKVRFRTISHVANTRSLVNNFAFSFCEEDGDNIWIGTDGGGISRWNRAREDWQHFVHQPGNVNSLSNNNVTSIVRDKQGNIWAATFGGGINRFDKRRQCFVHYKCIDGREDRFIWKLYLDAAGNLWAGACMGGAFYRYNPQADRFEVFDHSLKDVLTIAEDRNGQLWAGTYSSLVKVNKTGTGHQVFHLNLIVRSLYEDASGNFWVGTEEGGLLNFNRTNGSFTQITEKDGLPGNSILNIIPDNSGNLWMSTYNGVARFGTKDRRIKNFYASDGLQSNQFNYNAALGLSTGEILMGGIKGFNIFHPDSISERTIFPDLRISGLRISNEDAHPTTQVTLSYNKAMFSLDYVALEYSAPDKINYAYFLEGWDKDWNYVRQLRTANYSRLKEGDYILRVKSTNADGIWNPDELKIFIKVLPPWYRTWWAYCIYISLVAGMLYAYRLYQRRQARMDYELQLSRLLVEQEKELNEKKLSFFTNVSHEFRTPLTLIINPVKELLQDGGSENKNLSIVYRNARRLLSLVDQLLLFRKAESEEDKLKIAPLNITDLCRDVFLCFSHQAELKKIRFDFNTEEGLPLIYGDREKLEVAIFNLLSNAFKYTPDEGAISLSITSTTELINIYVKDTGCGISGEIGEKVFERYYQPRTREARRNGFGIGLYLVRKFVTSHGGQVSFESIPGNGTTFTICLPVVSAQMENIPGQDETMVTDTFLGMLAEDQALEKNAEEEPAAEDALEILLSLQPSMLIVDDNEQMREYIREIFRSRFTIYEASDGEEGVALAVKYLPDIVISDVLMDQLNGIDFCRRIKNDPALAHIPIVLLTGSASEETKLQGIEGGAEDYITKPFDKELFSARILNIIRSRHALQRYFYSEVTGMAGSQKIPNEHKEFMNRCISTAEKHLLDPDFNIRVLARELGISHSSLYKKIKAVSGRSVSEFIRLIRLRKAAELLITTECNISEAAYMVGFNDLRYFREQFSKVFEMTPSKYLQRYRRKFDKTPGNPA
ncbi:Signal transduction histidine kinase [Chitinophaga terrae (ex Kim and Jung 2007)]|uniref:histidine kinase n=1 Tax=Chitinophaga terrae (ex Kim and Jung 2007) TaxID=408074 RepID=A0A1H3YKF1_9BACT|nr:two-component regulator propeller domain-containing protein [Chitinophaga terrae (ex Kim and Jung 2007)]SEA11907.1 Signal transduction histidine kinase [Chitinophaga terrae (ex Kim and Jung 2007)]